MRQRNGNMIMKDLTPTLPPVTPTLPPSWLALLDANAKTQFNRAMAAAESELALG